MKEGLQRLKQEMNANCQKYNSRFKTCTEESEYRENCRNQASKVVDKVRNKRTKVRILREKADNTD